MMWTTLRDTGALEPERGSPADRFEMATAKLLAEIAWAVPQHDEAAYNRVAQALDGYRTALIADVLAKVPQERAIEQAPRRYTVDYRVPPMDASEGFCRTYRRKDPSLGIGVIGNYVPIPKVEWTTETIQLVAYDGREAEQRLELLLRERGYVLPGEPRHAVYELVDIRPCTP
jgi:hypothetical protein